MYSTVDKFYNPQMIPRSNLERENFTVLKVPPKPSLKMKWTPTSYASTVSPDVFGPSLWFTLHNGALRYPEHASPIVASRMKGFILGLPEMVPCMDCKEHARAHVENTDLDAVTKGREALFCYFVSFHNYVNKRYNKKTMACEEARKLYSGGVSVMRMTYE